MELLNTMKYILNIQVYYTFQGLNPNIHGPPFTYMVLFSLESVKGNWGESEYFGAFSGFEKPNLMKIKGGAIFKCKNVLTK